MNSLEQIEYSPNIIGCLMTSILVGKLKILEKDHSKIVLVECCRLVDSAILNYNLAIEKVNQEIDSKDVFSYRFMRGYPLYFEHSINSITRAYKLFRCVIKEEIYIKEKAEKINRLYRLKRYLTPHFISNYESDIINKFRNRIEHFDEDVHQLKIIEKNKAEQLQVKKTYNSITISGYSINIIDLKKHIQLYQQEIYHILDELNPVKNIKS